MNAGFFSWDQASRALDLYFLVKGVLLTVKTQRLKCLEHQFGIPTKERALKCRLPQWLGRRE